MGISWRLRDVRRAGAQMDLLWPDSVEIRPDHVRLGECWMRIYRVVGFPRQVEPGWLSPLFRFPRPHQLTFYTNPLTAEDLVGQMGRRLILQRGSDAANHSLGRLGDPARTQAAEDTDRLRQELARGETRMADIALMVALYETSWERLEESGNLLIALAEGMMMVLRVLRYQQERGLLAALPTGIWPEDAREMDTGAWATGFPFADEQIWHPHGQIWGEHAETPSLIVVDRFQMPSPHSVTMGWSGSGKSYFAKLEAVRSRYRGIAVAIIDPEGEYNVLRQVGAEVVPLGLGQAQLGFDPFVLDPSDRDGYDAQLEFIGRLLPRLTDGWTERHQSLLLRVAYKILEDGGDEVQRWDEALKTVDREAFDLIQMAVVRWRQLVGPPDFKPADSIPAFVVYDLSRVADRLKSAVYLVLAEMLARTTRQQTRRLVIIDEAWYLINDRDTAPYLEALFRRARKWGTALSLISQDFGDFTRTQAAEVCLRNAPLVLLLRQHPDSLNQLAGALHLTPQELQRIGGGGVGQGLLFVGEDHVPLNVWATDEEARLLNPSKLEVG